MSWLAGRLSIEANLSVSTSCWFGFDLEVGGVLSVTGLTTIGSELSIFGAVDVSTGQELEFFFFMTYTTMWLDVQFLLYFTKER